MIRMREFNTLMDGLIWWCWTIWDWTQDVVTTPRTQSKIFGALIFLSDSDLCSLKNALEYVSFLTGYWVCCPPATFFSFLGRRVVSVVHLVASVLVSVSLDNVTMLGIPKRIVKLPPSQLTLRRQVGVWLGWWRLVVRLRSESSS